MAEFQYLDKRVQRTKIAIHRAFFDLLKSKKYEQITIKDIIDAAGYSRGSFYNHYAQKDDLLEEIIESLFKTLSKFQRSSYINEKSIDIRELKNEPIYILEHFKECGEYYQILLSKNLNIEFRDRLSSRFIDMYLSDFDMQSEPKDDGINRELLNKYYAYGLINLIIEWVIDDFPLETEEFSSQLVKIFQYPLGVIQIKGNQ